MTTNPTPGARAEKAAPVIHITPEVYFVSRQSAIADTLFSPINGRSASGFYRRVAGGIRFYHADGSPFVFLVANPHDEFFFVSWSRDAKGRAFYAFGMSSADERAAGLEGMSHGLQSKLAESIWQSTSAFYCPRGYGECETARGCIYPGRCGVR